ncbi:MAG: hypothetical protein WBM78_21700, partial [Desulfobacterales bacterium]
MHFSLGCAVLTITILLDRLLNPEPFFQEWPPELSLFFILRGIGLAVSSYLLLKGARAIVIANTHKSESRYLDLIRPSFQAGAIIGMLLSLTFAFLVIMSPKLLSWFVQEDGVVEWGSAFFAFMAGMCILIGAWRCYAKKQKINALILTILAGIMVLLGLEEVSWFQRLLDLPTPEFFEGNRQREINFHNFATVGTANAYFLGACIFSVVTPYLFSGRVLPGRYAFLSILIPPRLVMYSAAFAAAITYKMWNVIPIQLTFWLSLMALWTDTPSSHGCEKIGKISAVVLILTLSAFLIFGENMGRSM